MKNLLPSNGELFYYPDFLTPGESQSSFSNLLTNVPWKQEDIIIYGKKIPQPRLTAWYGDKEATYKYSGLALTPLPWIITLRVIKEKVEKISGISFNSALLNLYRNGADSMGWHRDNEKQLGNDPVIASVSLGAVRKFQLREYTGKNSLQTFEPADGSLILMSGPTQTYWEHSVPKTTKVSSPRINITFRKVFF